LGNGSAIEGKKNFSKQSLADFASREHAILTSFNPDFSGQKWTLRKSSGGKTGGAYNSDEILSLGVKLWRGKKFPGV
jgi:hypothetical protein